MSQKKKHVYRLCPCDICDIESIQSWLEDMAAQGLFLTQESAFCGFFTFEKDSPRKVLYRLDVAQKQKPRFFAGRSDLTEDEIEAYKAMGWEYLFLYGDFRIYRSISPNVPELNTENQTHALTVGYLKRSYRKSFILVALLVLFWLLHAGSALSYAYMNILIAGPFFAVCVYCFLLLATFKTFARLRKLRRFEKQLLDGVGLHNYIDWKNQVFSSYFLRVVPVVLCCGLAISLMTTWLRSSEKIPLDAYPEEPPFATMADTFPDAVSMESHVWLDYGTAVILENPLATNIEWNENCDITTADGENYHCIFLLDYHEVKNEWLAKGLEKDYYIYDSHRFSKKRFQDQDVPDLGIDSVRVYNCYGSLYVLMRQDNRVAHAVVHLDNRTDQNQWLLWAKAMAQMMR